MYRVKTVITGPQGSPYLSTMHFDESGGTAQQAANAVATFWGAIDNLMHTSAVWATQADVALVDEVTGDLTGVTGVTTATGTGIDATDLLPEQSQMLIRWFTSAVVRGRRLRGRTFIPALTKAASTGGNVTAAWRTASDAAAAALIADANSVLIIWHRPVVTPPATGGSASVNSGSTWNDFATLRSRRD